MPPRSALITLAVGVVVVLVAGAIVGSRVVRSPALSAAGLLAEYAAAIQSGDLAEADALSRPNRGAHQPVGGDALADPADRITAVTTKITSSTGDSAVGRVSFDLGGARHDATVRLRTGPAQLGVLPNWQVTSPLTSVISLKVPTPGTATVNGVETPFGSDLVLTVYPGRYLVGLAGDNRWYTSTAVSVAAGGSTVTAAPSVAPTSALGDAVLAKIAKAIDACVATAVPVPGGCPFSEPALGTLDGFSWHLDRYPTIAFLDPTHVFLQGGQVTANFALTYSYIHNKPESDPIAIKGTGTVTFSGDAPSVAITAG